MARERVTWIDTARGGALTLVVLVHSSLWLHRSGYRTAHWLDQMNLALDAVRMPTLVAISGLFAATIGTWSAREVLRRRVLPLALLYVVWAALGQIIVGPYAIASGTKTKSIGRRRRTIQQLPGILLGTHDPRQPQDGKRRIIRMYGHLQARSFRHRHHLLKKIE